MPGLFSTVRILALTTTVLVPLAAFAQDATELATITVNGRPAGVEEKGYVPHVTKSATKTLTPIEKTAQTVNVVTADQIADQAATSVAQALRYTPGILTEYRGSSNLHDETFVRGFYYVPRFLDGLAFGSGSFGQIDPWLLERIDLIKGPSSVLYGQANPGGLIDMTTKKANGERIREVRTTFGSGDRVGLSYDVGDKLGDTLDWRFVGTAWRVDTQEKGEKQQRYAFAPSLRWTPTDDTTVTLIAILQNEPDAGYRNFREAAGTVWDTAIGRKIPANFLVSDPDYDRSQRNTRAIGAEIEHKLGDDTVIRANARVQRITSYYRTLVWGSLQNDGTTISRLGSGGTENLSQALLDLAIEHRLQTGPAQHTLLAGVDAQTSRRDYQWGYNYGAPSIDWTDPVYGINVGDYPLTERSNTHTTARQTGIYVQDVVEMGPWTLSAGLRHDDFDTRGRDNASGSTTRFDDTATTGRIGALYTFANGIAPYVSYSTSFEPVTESSGTDEPFKPTTAKQVEAGVKWASADGRYFAQAAAYDLTQSNVLTYDNNWTYRQIGRIASRGVELEGRAEVGNGWSVIASAGWIDSQVKESAMTSEVGKTPARMPKTTAALWTKYTSPQGWDAGFGVRHIGHSEGNAANTFEVSPVTLYDLSVGYDFGNRSPDWARVHGQINVSNLTNKYYTASCASAYACFVGSERTVIATLDFKF